MKGKSISQFEKCWSILLPIVTSFLSLSLILGFIYPAYKSWKALSTPCPDDDKQWLTYWVVYAFATSIENATDKLIFWFPFYYLAKIFFVIWLMSPKFQGALILFNKFLEPFLSKHEDKIDEKIVEIEVFITDFVNKLRERGLQYIAEAMQRIPNLMSQISQQVQNNKNLKPNSKDPTENANDSKSDGV